MWVVKKIKTGKRWVAEKAATSKSRRVTSLVSQPIETSVAGKRLNEALQYLNRIFPDDSDLEKLVKKRKGTPKKGQYLKAIGELYTLAEIKALGHKAALLRDKVEAQLGEAYEDDEDLREMIRARHEKPVKGKLLETISRLYSVKEMKALIADASNMTALHKDYELVESSKCNGKPKNRCPSVCAKVKGKKGKMSAPQWVCRDDLADLEDA